MRLLVLKGVSFFLFFCFTSIVYSQNSLTLKKGKVLDSLVVPEINSVFSIYLPKAFDLHKKWPVVFGFDSNGNTSQITRLYKEAAEEYGYMVVVSDFPEKLKVKEKAEYVASFVDHIFSVFPIQKDRVYMTGIGEDAKLISLVSVLLNNVAGTIAIGESRYYNDRVKINKNFSYFGILSTNNFRYVNFLKNKNYLTRKAIAAEIISYEGGSDIPSSGLLKKPLLTFTLQAMSKGRIPKDSIWIKKMFVKELEETEVLLTKNKFISAHGEVKRIKNSYSIFFDTAYLKDRLREIKKMRGYKKEKRLRTKYANQEYVLRETYLFSLDEDIEGERYENLGWWQYQILGLDTLQTRKEKYASEMVERIKGYLKNVVDIYKKGITQNQDNFEKKIFLNILSTIIDKKDFESYRTIISLSAQDQDNETALFYLEKLLKNGFKDKETLYNIEGTLALRISKPYNVLIEKYLGSSKYLFSE